jgi:hypothetical protein
MRLKKYFAILSIVAICSTTLVGCSSATSDVSETTTETSAHLDVEPPKDYYSDIDSSSDVSDYESSDDVSSDSEPEPNTTEMVDYIASKAKKDAKAATDEDIQAAVDWLKANKYNYFSGNENMEKTMYYGYLLEEKYMNTENDYEKVGFQAYKTVKYVYRGLESIKDAHDNLLELQEMVDAL